MSRGVGGLSFGAMITAARNAAGFTQTELAGRLAIDPANISRWENDRQRPKPRMVARLADVLALDEATLWQAISAQQEHETTEVRRELSDTVAVVERFVEQYQELGHTYRRLDEAVEKMTGTLEQISSQLAEALKLLRKNTHR